MTSPIATALPLRRDLTVAYASSVGVAFVLVVASIAGLVLGSEGLYDAGSPLVQVSRGGDAVNLAIGVPILVGSMWLARRGSLIGLLLWPGALFYIPRRMAPSGTERHGATPRLPQSAVSGVDLVLESSHARSPMALVGPCLYRPIGRRPSGHRSSRAGRPGSSPP